MFLTSTLRFSVNAFFVTQLRVYDPNVATRWNERKLYDRSVLFNSFTSRLQSHQVDSQSTSIIDEDNEYVNNDEALLEAVSIEKLKDLCVNLKLSNKGTKFELLSRLRTHAEEQAQSDRERKLRLVDTIEKGMDEEGNGKARHTIINEPGDNVEDDLDGFFYFSIPDNDKPKKKPEVKNANATNASKSPTSKNSQNRITSPSFPSDVQPNADGERVVTTYSSNDRNDLTSVAEQYSSNGATMGGNSNRASATSKPEDSLLGGPFGDQSGSQRRKASDKEMDDSVEIITELVNTLLAMTGAPGFLDEDVSMENEGNVFSESEGSGFIGFDPSRVPASILTENTKAIRTGNGDALRKVLNDFEMQAIGLDGRAGDDKDRGGGHYLEVQKVTNFLEGFRKAEVRRVARETTTMLLKRLVTDGVKGLDEMLMVMTKGGDSSTDESLNDSLVLYLEDAIRQQEKKVGKKVGIHDIKGSWKEMTANVKEDDLDTANLWNVTTNGKGEVIESLDPNDPSVKEILESQLKSSAEKKVRAPISTNPAEQLLILLTLLKERVKAEAVFSNDEKGRNLRVLAYCLHAANEKEREAIVMDHFGSSLDRLDSFSELLTSAIDYAECTSHQLQPSKSGPLDIRLLNTIKDTVKGIMNRNNVLPH